MALRCPAAGGTGPGHALREAPSEESLREIYRPIRRDLFRTERLLARAAFESSRFIRPMARYVLGRPGKRIRAALALFSARAGRTVPDRAAELAAAVEMLHVASLVHDDILDGATVRRNQRSLHAAWGVHRAVLTGDYLFARNFCLLADRLPLSVMRCLLQASQLLCDGAIEETDVAFNAGVSEDRYLKIIGKKTAALMAAAGEGGAILAGAPPPVRVALRTYGHSFGMAFQLIDDALDFSARQRVIGKPVGADLVEGKFTMPVLHVRHVLKGRDYRDFRRLLTPVALSNGATRQVVGMVRRHGGLEHTFERAGSYLGKALAAIEDVPERARAPLRKLAIYAMGRRK